MRGVSVLCVAACCCLSLVRGELKLDPIYQSHMVLQRGVPVPISGTCSASTPVTVSFGGHEVKAKPKGKKWHVTLPAMEANAEGAELTVSQGKESESIDDVVVGEVWLASGQSNMLWRLEQTGDSSAIAAANIPQLRFYHSEPQVHTDDTAYTEELSERLKKGEMYEGSWSVSDTTTCRRMSAVGWYFGRKLQELLGVPIGIVHASLGGSEMLAWMPQATLKKRYKDCLTPRWLESKYVTEWVRGRAKKNIGSDLSAQHPYKPGYLFTTGISPWLRFPFAGVIWYQGESDAEIDDMAQHKAMLTDLINSWRTQFKKQNLPFLMVQLPRINDDSPLRANWPEFRDVQTQVARELPNVYQTVTIDLGSTNSNVHPPRKLEVGERLATLAAAKVYGKDIVYEGPVFSAATLSDGKLHLSFSSASGLTTTDGQPPRDFEVSADGKKFHAADAEIDGESIQLSLPSQVKKPKVVRYAWKVYVEPNLVNGAGLPTAPFTAPVLAH